MPSSKFGASSVPVALGIAAVVVVDGESHGFAGDAATAKRAAWDVREERWPGRNTGPTATAAGCGCGCSSSDSGSGSDSGAGAGAGADTRAGEGAEDSSKLWSKYAETKAAVAPAANVDVGVRGACMSALGSALVRSAA